MKIICNFARVLLGGLLFFILLNCAGLLQFGSDPSSWNALTRLILMVWFLLEGSNFILKRFSIKPINGVSWLLFVQVVYVNSMGKLLNFYVDYQWYDLIAHFVGGMAVASLCFFAIRNFCYARNIKIRILAVAFISLTTTTFFGVLWEIIEYLEDSFLGSYMLGDGVDTVGELAMDILGALLTISLISIYFYKKRSFKNP